MKRQRGAALLIALVIVVLGVSTGLLSAYSQRNIQAERDQITDAALTRAKAALIAYAVSRPVGISGTLANAARPGDLPCPDRDNNGQDEPDCGNGSGSTYQDYRLGRLPWITLELPDLRDGSGERLWYAVSSNFKQRYRYNSPVNSDTPGTISIRDASGNLLRDAQAGQGVVAVIIAPGNVLRRPSSVSDPTPYTQARSLAGQNTAQNYLELVAAEDNADFVDNTQNGFIAGPVRDANGSLISNDRMIWITAEELALAMEKRVIAEVVQCLREYGQYPDNGGRYPWTAPDTSFMDATGSRFGRIPDNPFTRTRNSAAAMQDTWTGDCNINSNSGWWPNWKELVFYGLADFHKPDPAVPIGNCSSVTPFVNCLSLNGHTDRQFVVIVAGRRIATTAPPQSRSTTAQKNSASNYLEGSNVGGNLFITAFSAAPFNDVVRPYP